MADELETNVTDDAAAAAPASEDPVALAAKAEGIIPDGETNDAAAAAESDADAGSDAASGVPDTYSFDLPEGVTINDEYLGAMTPVFKELGLTQEAAQKLISAHSAQVVAGDSARADAFVQLTKDWLEGAKADKEIGGEAFEPSVQAARAAVEKFGSPELHELLKNYGLGNNPEIIRVFSRVGKLLKEDQPGNAAAASNAKPDRAETMYPDAK